MATAPRPLTELTAGVYLATATTWTSSSVLVVDEPVARGSEVLVVDPGITPDEVAGLAAAVKDRGWRVTAGLATHPHWDHVLWSTALGAVPRFAAPRAVAQVVTGVERLWADAEQVAPGHERELFGRLTPVPGLPAHLTGPQFAGLPAPAPPGCTVVAHDAHAPGHLALVTRGVLLAGDMLSDVEVPFLDVGPGGDPAHAPADPLGDYRAALDALAAAARDGDVEVLVPGHGTPARGAAAIAARFAADHAYLDALEREAAGGAQVGDLRLAEEWVAGEHAHQLELLRSRA
ncbi:MBL fold metallo-hydrolase [Xylanimonas oleitrophica]|uniref:MBL fold metallo-hydrolase n=1 Tax=Xylanimonas oleitrophica TaxID=2607479 RepID=A0A2W5X390_9MICO|nr:MBL fold metallo-hydrolase [Xylanimonas oleitrophica]PZR55406.1 MBL fold metallo-hydrolase [Xylanimonas oleitrophica]